MAQKVFGVVYDQGDGSATIRWFRDEATVTKLVENEQEYYMNEGEVAYTLTFPDDLDLRTCGFTFSG